MDFLSVLSFIGNFSTLNLQQLKRGITQSQKKKPMQYGPQARPLYQVHTRSADGASKIIFKSTLDLPFYLLVGPTVLACSRSQIWIILSKNGFFEDHKNGRGTSVSE